MIIDWLQIALHSFNLNTPNWYGWRTHDDNGNKIPNNERMCWEHTIVIKDGAVKPTKQELEDRIEQLKIEYENNIAQELANKQSALNKLKALGLNDDEIKSIIGN
jgi:Rho Binding